jgi:hypothetical protein
VGLLLAHPELPSCAACQEWLYNPETWRPYEAGGRPVRRPRGTPTPCCKCPKSRDRVHPAPEAELSAKNLRSLELYQRIRAGQPMPADPIIRKNCGLIRMVEEQVQREQQRDFLELLKIVLFVKR